MAAHRRRSPGGLGRKTQSERVPKKKPSPLPIAAQLDQRALAYLNRYDASVVQLRRVLQRFERKVDANGEAGVAAAIEALLERYQRSGLLDDARYARNVALGLRDRGQSKLGILAKLRSRGIAEADARGALSAVDEDAPNPDAELEAARRYARRRRLGPHRPDSERAAKAQRDLAALARAGFSYDVARAVIGTDALTGDVF